MNNQSESMTLIPYLNVDNASEAISFYARAFGAAEILRLTDPNDGRVGHAELQFGSARIMISDEYPDFGALGPSTLGGTPVKLVLTVENADEIYAQAIEQGAISLRKMRDEFHGVRSGQVADPFGHVWFIQSKSSALSPDEMQAKWNESAAN